MKKPKPTRPPEVPFDPPTWPSFIDRPFGVPLSEPEQADETEPKRHKLKTGGSIPRERVCRDCGKMELVRSDNRSLRCRWCASSKNGKSGRQSRYSKNPPPLIQCAHCRKDVYASKFQKFCSMVCLRAANSVERTCKKCKKVFRVANSVVSGLTNSSGNFCCRPCYDQWLYKGAGMDRGPYWTAARREAIRRNPFCALCGTLKNLHVHHIIPYRLTQDNRQENLLPLCRRHHKIVEVFHREFEDIERGIQGGLGMLWLRRSSLIDQQSITRYRLTELIRELNAQAS